MKNRYFFIDGSNSSSVKVQFRGVFFLIIDLINCAFARGLGFIAAGFKMAYVFISSTFIRGMDFLAAGFKTAYAKFWLVAKKVKRFLYLPVYNFILRIKRVRYRLVRHEAFVTSSPVSIATLHEARAYEANGVYAVDQQMRNIEIAPRQDFTVKPIRLMVVADVSVEAWSNFVFSGNAALVHDYYDFRSDYTSEELHGRFYIDEFVVEREPVVGSQNLETAALFLDALSSNYAHWLTEVLTRLVMFASMPEYKNIPIVIDEGWHANMLEILEMFIEDRDIYVLAKGRALNVKKAYVLSSCGYVPFESRPNYCGSLSSGVFAIEALRAIRKGMLAKAFISSSNRVYIKRKSKGRNALNSEEVDSALKKLGFVSYDPALMSPLEQISVFSCADVIYSNSGAALANIIFCKPGARVYISIPDIEGTSYQYWNKISMASGAMVKYFLEEPEIQSIHSDFEVNIDRIYKEFNQ